MTEYFCSICYRKKDVISMYMGFTLCRGCSLQARVIAADLGYSSELDAIHMMIKKQIKDLDLNSNSIDIQVCLDDKWWR